MGGAGRMENLEQRPKSVSVLRHQFCGYSDFEPSYVTHKHLDVPYWPKTSEAWSLRMCALNSAGTYSDTQCSNFSLTGCELCGA